MDINNVRTDSEPLEYLNREKFKCFKSQAFKMGTAVQIHNVGESRLRPPPPPQTRSSRVLPDWGHWANTASIFKSFWSPSGLRLSNATPTIFLCFSTVVVMEHFSKRTRLRRFGRIHYNLSWSSSFACFHGWSTLCFFVAICFISGNLGCRNGQLAVSTRIGESHRPKLKAVM